MALNQDNAGKGGRHSPSRRAPSARDLPKETGRITGQSPTFLLQPSADAEWSVFQDGLATVLTDLEEDEFLILSVNRSHIFVQFAAQERFGMHAEAVSDAYLDKPMHGYVKSRLLELGWNGPTNLPEAIDPEGHTPDRSPNFFLDVAWPVPFVKLAALAVATLRTAFNAGHPGSLQYKSFGRDHGEIRFPMVRISRE